MSNHPDPMSKPVPFGFSLTAGAGLILMILALAFGVVQGVAANGSVIGLTFVGGLALLIFGIAGWLAVVQPFNHFDDINVPQYTGHAADAHAAPHTDDHAIIPHEETAVLPHE